jgi:hypothetical protein
LKKRSPQKARGQARPPKHSTKWEINHEHRKIPGLILIGETNKNVTFRNTFTRDTGLRVSHSKAAQNFLLNRSLSTRRRTESPLEGSAQRCARQKQAKMQHNKNTHVKAHNATGARRTSRLLYHKHIALNIFLVCSITRVNKVFLNKTGVHNFPF